MNNGNVFSTSAAAMSGVTGFLRREFKKN